MALSTDGSTVVASAPLEGADSTDAFEYSVVDAAGADRHGHGVADGCAASGATAAGAGRLRDDDPRSGR